MYNCIDSLSLFREVKMKIFKSKRKGLLVLIDFVILLFVYAFCISLMSVSGGTDLEIWAYPINFLIFAFFILSSRVILSVYSYVLRYANSTVYMLTVCADILGAVLSYAITSVLYTVGLHLGAWKSLAFVCMASIATLSSRFLYQMWYRHENKVIKSVRDGKIGVAIVGAGQIGALLAEELIYNTNSHYNPICFIDIDKNKVGSRICGLEVYNQGYGALRKIKSLPIQEIFIAVPKMNGKRVGELHDFYARTGCKVKIYDFPIADTENTGRRVIREFKIEDLLFRDAIEVSNEATRNYYGGKTVLVTGGGGSIGSELCRQVAACKPEKLVVFDIYENNAYAIQQELLRKYGDNINLVVEIGSVRDRARLNSLFSTHRPDIVIHAAAHKHVPLMEHSCAEAVKNNVLGTYNTADMAEKYGAEKFILISTDKAVNPTNVMGASKRMCEMVIQCRTDSQTTFTAVRFGNVLGSNGSVIPLFKQQIELGGPVTVTDKRIIRYFMTIPEASGLVMQAGAMAKAGDLFVLDMGNPVRILDLAENMIRLSGFVPYEDIDIVETGLRPGEKLYEELLIKTENLAKTTNNMIFIEHDTPHSRGEIEDMLATLKEAARLCDEENNTTYVVKAMKQVVSTFHDPESVNKNADDTDQMKMVTK